MKKQKILLSIPGHLKTVPMNRFTYEALLQMGHDVEVFDFGASNVLSQIHKSISKKSFFETMNRSLLKKIESFKPDILLSIFGFDHDENTLKNIAKQGVKTACWWLNDPFQIERSMRQVGNYTHYFTNAKGSVDEYKKRGYENVFYMPVGCFPDVHKRIDGVEKIYDITFAGDHGHVREEVIGALIEEFTVSIFGPWKKLPKNSPINKHIVSRKFFTPEEMVRIFNQSKIVLNIHSWFGKSNFGINPRVIEANGCGAFQICDFKEDIADLYEDKKEIVLYKNIEELKEQLTYYLSHESQRESIANAAYEKSIKSHLYTQRLESMLQTILG